MSYERKEAVESGMGEATCAEARGVGSGLTRAGAVVVAGWGRGLEGEEA